jgi:serine/threonine-protein kinase
MEPGAFAPIACTSCGALFVPAAADQGSCDPCRRTILKRQLSARREDLVAGHRLLQALGRGRYGTTWLAESPDGGPSLVKLLTGFSPDAKGAARFAVEADRLAELPRLRHGSIAALLDSGIESGNVPFLVYATGGDATLADELRSRGRLGACRSLELCAELADALDLVHRAGVAHVALKPANVGLSHGAEGLQRAVLLDFATAHLLATSGLDDRSPGPIATAAYVSPEEARGELPRPESDIYALGVLLFHCLTGRLPVVGTTPQELYLAHREHAPLTLRDAGRTPPAELENLLSRMLSKHPAARPGSAAEVAEALRAVPLPGGSTPPFLAADTELPLVGESIPDGAAAPPSDAPEPARRNPATILVVAAGVTLAVIVVSLGLALRDLRAPGKAPPGGVQSLAASRQSVPVSHSGLAPVSERASRSAAAATSGIPGMTPPSVPAGAVAGVRAGTMVAGGAPVTAATRVPPVATTPPEPRDGPVRAALRRAQMQVAAGDAQAAERILLPLLDGKLARRDRALALRLLGAAEAKRGHRDSALGWYRKSLPVTDDADERARIGLQLQKLMRTR